MQRTAVAITHQQRMKQGILRLWYNRLLRLLILRLLCNRLLWLLILLLRCNRLLRLLILRLWRNWLLRLLILRLRCNRLLRLLILRLRCYRLLRLLILLLRCYRLLRLLYRFNNWRKQRFVWTIIQQRFHWRKFKIIQRERIRPSRLFAGITLLLSLSKLTSQFCLCRSICIFCVHGHIMLILFAIALLLRLGELTCQFILLHRIDFIIVVLIARIVLITLGFAGFFFCRTL